MEPFCPFTPSFQSHGNGACVSSLLFLHLSGMGHTQFWFGPEQQVLIHQRSSHSH